MKYRPTQACCFSRLGLNFQFDFGVLLFLLVLLVLAVIADIEEDEDLCQPKHVHIAYGDALTEIVIMWATQGNCSTQVNYGVMVWKLDQTVKGTFTEFWEQNAKGLQFIHRAKLTDLRPSVSYFYRPLSNGIGSRTFFFETPQLDENWSPKFLVFGDLGVHTRIIPTLVEEALKGEYTALLHVGDIAYNLRDDDGRVGDTFMQLIEPVAAHLPYMTCPGNHESDSDTFIHYIHRFSMPQSPWPMSVEKLWYSFDVGLVHFISYSTEVFFTLNKKMVDKQLDWLVLDLKRADAQRKRRPWIVAFGHRPMYCSMPDEDCTRNDSLVRSGFEDVFYHYGVDIVLQAHEHNYERLFPVYKGVVLSNDYVNPKAPVQIISGAAGNKEAVSSFQSDVKAEWSAIRKDNSSLNSYGVLKVINASHVYWEQRSVYNHEVLDFLWIVQCRHGKFAGQSLPGNLSHEFKSADHPGLFEEATSPNKETLQKSDNTVRLIIGVCFGVVFCILLIIFIITKVFRRRRYRIVRRWSPDDFDDDQRLDSPRNDLGDDIDVDYEMDCVNTSMQSNKLLQGS